MLLVLLLTLLDGSQVTVKAPETTEFELVTAYGTLKVPAKALCEVTFGAHADNPSEFTAHVANLKSTEWKQRQAATVFLRTNSRAAYPFLLPLKTDPDHEVATRAKQLLDDYPDPPPTKDVLLLVDGSKLIGVLRTKEVAGENECLGTLAVKLSQIKTLTVRMRPRKISIEHAKGWQAIGYTSGAIKIKATGQVDLWPQGPGQYVCGPAGYNASNTTGHPNSFPFGALIGRIGQREFLVGDNWKGELERGTLELRINNSAWPGSVPQGAFEVSVE